MGLVDLPLEILDTILDSCLPTGIESLALVCKAVYERAAPQLRRHNSLKRKWKCANNNARHINGDVLRILYDISCDPLIARYIETLNLSVDWLEEGREAQLPEGADGNGAKAALVGDGEGARGAFDVAARDQAQSGSPSDDRIGNTEHEGEAALYNFRADPEAMTRIRSITAETLTSLGAQVSMEDFWKDMTAEDHVFEDVSTGSACVVVALLGQLPNVRTLSLPEWWDNDNIVLDAVRDALKSIIEGHSTNRIAKPLGRLKALLRYQWPGYDERSSLQNVQHFLTLPTLTELYLISAVAVKDDGYTGIPFEWRMTGYSSSLTRVEFASCCMDADGLSNLLRHTPALSDFKYSHETKWHCCQYDWNPGSFVQAIVQHCGNTITNLAITIDEVYGSMINGCSNFQALPKLEILEVDVLLFCGPPVESGQRLGEEAFCPEGDTPWTKVDIPCIGSIMPESIVEVHINIGHPDPDEEALTALLKNLKEQRLERLHKLERCIIRQHDGDNARVVAIRAGATVEVVDFESDEESLGSNMPLWKRNFWKRIGRLATGKLD